MDFKSLVITGLSVMVILLSTIILQQKTKISSDYQIHVTKSGSSIMDDERLVGVISLDDSCKLNQIIISDNQ